MVEQHNDAAEATVPGSTGTETASAAPHTVSEESDAADRKPARPGHGRNGADAYSAAEQVDVPHGSLQAGDPCPACAKGTVYDKAPGVLVRITGQPPLAARIYHSQKLRCHLCGQIFTAAAPPPRQAARSTTPRPAA